MVLASRLAAAAAHRLRVAARFAVVRPQHQALQDLKGAAVSHKVCVS